MAHLRRDRGPGSRRLRWWSIGLVLALVVAGGALAGARSLSTTEDVPALTDEEGRSLTLRGFSTAGSAKQAPDGLPDLRPADIEAEYADMGTNFVRFLISWRAVEPEPGHYDQAYLDGVAERVDWYAERGYHVMLDMHQDLYGTEIVPSHAVGNGAPGWATHSDGLPIGEHEMWELYYLDPGVIRAFDNFWNTTGEHPELRTHYVGAWEAVAERFADEPAVIAYDLMNEPYGGSLQGPAFEAGPLTSLYQSAADAIRTVDDSTWLCLEPQAMGVNWATPTGLGPVDDPRDGPARIAYCPHLYPLPMDLGSGYTGTTKTLVDGTVQTWLTNTLRTSERLGDVPVVLGEFGLDTTKPGALEYVDAVYDVADDHGFGVAYWSRDPGSWGPYDAEGEPRNLVAALDRPYPRSVAGAVGAIDADEHELTFDVSPSGGLTAEVYLPDDFSPGPGRPEVTVDGGEVSGWDGTRRVLEVMMDPEASEISIRAGS
ncbi:cellulase family glycosylhydrolase [Janibacter cremeus]|uniref:Endoglycosylceramidase n=1 Tax=Janibacter cremeus TaxID=1285192 RepID=A0A852VRV2_9MICO|nr:endoglycosylceramidase [Janibacter cremeus]